MEKDCQSHDIIKALESGMIVNIFADDPVFNYLSGYQVNQNGGQLTFNMSNRLIYNKYIADGRNGLDSYGGTSGSQTKSELYNYDRLETGNIHSISIISRGSKSKPVSGDGIRISTKLTDNRSEPNLSKIDVDMGILDGQTNPLILDNKAIEYATKFVPTIKDAQTDQIALLICAYLEPIIRQPSFEFASKLLIMGFTEYEVNRLVSELKYRAPDKDSNKALASWKYSNLALRLAYGGFQEDSEIGNVPGFTGTNICISESSSADGKLEISGVSDTPLFLIYESGLIHKAYLESNGKYDRETVIKMRELISKGIVNTPKDAIIELTKNGHYERSYKDKMNNRLGNVAVCNGHKYFPEYALSNLPFSTNTTGLLAIVAMTDGGINGLNHYKKGLDKRGVTTLIKKLLLGESINQLIPWINLIENNSYLDKNGLPTREKESDDILIATTLMHPSTYIDELVSQPNFLFML